MEDEFFAPPAENDTEDIPPVEPAPPAEPSKPDPTKAYSERLKKDREKIRQEERLAMAKEFGFET